MLHCDLLISFFFASWWYEITNVLVWNYWRSSSCIVLRYANVVAFLESITAWCYGVKPAVPRGLSPRPPSSLPLPYSFTLNEVFILLEFNAYHVVPFNLNMYYKSRIFFFPFHTVLHHSYSIPCNNISNNLQSLSLTTHPCYVQSDNNKIGAKKFEIKKIEYHLFQIAIGAIKRILGGPCPLLQNIYGPPWP